MREISPAFGAFLFQGCGLSAKRRIKLGVLYSRSGDYAMLSNAACTGVAAAIELVNADPALDLCFDPIERDPQGNIDAYGPLCNDCLLYTSRCV